MSSLLFSLRTTQPISIDFGSYNSFWSISDEYHKWHVTMCVRSGFALLWGSVHQLHVVTDAKMCHGEHLCTSGVDTYCFYSETRWVYFKKTTGLTASVKAAIETVIKIWVCQLFYILNIICIGKKKILLVLNSLSTRPWRLMGKWMYRFILSWPRNLLKVSGQLHVSTTSPPWIQTRYQPNRKLSG
jgi:hypothetical protein